MGWSGSLLILQLALASGLAPADHAARDLYIRFERDSYHGNVYLNSDGSYLIVQTGPDDATVSFTGAWIARGISGFCIKPQTGAGGKCFEQMPQAMNQKMSVVSDLNETYVVELKKGR